MKKLFIIFLILGACSSQQAKASDPKAEEKGTRSPEMITSKDLSPSISENEVPSFPPKYVIFSEECLYELDWKYQIVRCWEDKVQELLGYQIALKAVAAQRRKQ